MQVLLVVFKIGILGIHVMKNDVNKMNMKLCRIHRTAKESSIHVNKRSALLAERRHTDDYQLCTTRRTSNEMADTAMNRLKHITVIVSY